MLRAEMRLATAAFGLLALCSAGCRSKSDARPAPKEMQAPAEVVAFARIQPAGEIIDIGAPGDDRVAEVLVKEGQDVAAQTPLFHLGRHALWLAEVARAAARLADARALQAAETSLGEARVSEAQVLLAKAEELPLLDVRVLEDDVRRLEGLEGASAEVELDRKRRAVTRAQRDHVLGMAEAKSRLEAERGTLLRAQRALNVPTLQAEKALADAQLELTIVRAPIAGRILKVFAKPGERAGPQPLLKMGESQRMEALAEIDRSLVRWVKQGQRASIESSALAKPLGGVVERVGWMVYRNDLFADDPTAPSNGRVVQVTIRLDDPEPLNRLSNLEVEARIQTGPPAPAK
jgi:HlyD family secretion protein